MNYLSPQIESLSKRKNTASLINQQVSCGIFQDYWGCKANHFNPAGEIDQ